MPEFQVRSLEKWGPEVKHRIPSESMALRASATSQAGIDMTTSGPFTYLLGA